MGNQISDRDPVKECTYSDSMVSRYQPAPQASAVPLTPYWTALAFGRATFTFSSSGHRGQPCESDDRLSDHRLAEPSILFRKKRRHPGAGRRGPTAPVPTS